MSHPDDVVLAKASTIERCIRRFRAEHAACASPTDYSHHDAMLLNIERACQAAIDLAMHICAARRLGIPQGAAQAFELLAAAGLIPQALCASLKGMVGYRNVAIHEYQELDASITSWIVGAGYLDLVAFVAALGVRIEAPP